MSRPPAHSGSIEPHADPRARAHDAASPEPLPAGTVLLRYRLDGVVHSDELGLVYRATDLEDGADVAIKELFPSAHAVRAEGLEVVPRGVAGGTAHALELAMQRRVFAEQGKLLAGLQCDSTPSVLAEWQAQGTFYRANPWIEGTTLAARFAMVNGPADEWLLRSILGPLLDALQGLHRRGVQHGRLTPGRVLLTKDMRVLLLGLRAVSDRADTPAEPGRASADDAYAPPELLGLAGSEQGAPRVGPWSDIYSVGAIVHRAITGVPPALSTPRLVHGEPQSLARIAAGDYDAGFLRAIDWALSIQPQERPRNVDQFCARLGLGDRRVAASVTATASQTREAAPGQIRLRELPDGPTPFSHDQGPVRAAPVSRRTAEIPSPASGFADTEVLDTAADAPMAAPPPAGGTSIWLPLSVPMPEVRVTPASAEPAAAGPVVIAPRPSDKGDPTGRFRAAPASASQAPTTATGDGVAAALDPVSALEPPAGGGSLISIMSPRPRAHGARLAPPIQPTLPMTLGHGRPGRRFLGGRSYAVLAFVLVLAALWATHWWHQKRPRSASGDAPRAAPTGARDRASAPAQALVNAKPMAAPAAVKTEPTYSAPSDTMTPLVSARDAPPALQRGAPPEAATAVAAATPSTALPTGRAAAGRTVAAQRPTSHDARCADLLVRLSLGDTSPSDAKTKPQGACP